MKLKIYVVTIIGLAALGISDWVVRAQSPSSAPGGVYTEAQAKRGQALYEQSCAECHGTSLNGAEGPPLLGTEFTSGWTGKTLGDLLERIQLTMPAGSPGHNTIQEKADMMAYMLSLNNFRAGTTDLAADIEALKRIPFDQPKP